MFKNGINKSIFIYYSLCSFLISFSSRWNWLLRQVLNAIYFFYTSKLESPISSTGLSAIK